MVKLPPLTKLDLPSVRRQFQKINQQLSPDVPVVFGELHVTGAVTAYGGRDVLRYAVMMAAISRRDH